MIGVECEPADELALRRLAEDNHGSFKHKRFECDSQWFASEDDGDGRGAEGSMVVDTRLTVGGQLSVIDVMVEEHKRLESDWLEEQKCANRLLLTTATQQPVPTRADQRHLQRKMQMSGAQQAQLGGGYVYADDAPTTTLRDLFGVAPKPPWEASGEAVPFDPRLSRAPQTNDRTSLPRERETWNRRAGAAEAHQTPHWIANQVPESEFGGKSDSLRRPSLVNPWDSSANATIRVSEQAKRLQKAGAGIGLGPRGGGRPKSPGSARAKSPNRAASTQGRGGAKSPRRVDGGGARSARSPRSSGGPRPRPPRGPAGPPDPAGAMGIVGRERRWSF